MEDFVVPWKVSGLLHWVSGFRQSVWGFEVRVCFTLTSWVIEELGVFLMAFYDISGPTRTRHGVWRVSVGFMVVWFALYLKHRDFWVLDWAWGVLDGLLPFKGLPWTLRWSSWTDREQDFRVLDRSGGLLKGVPWTLTCSSRILKGRLGCSQGFFMVVWFPGSWLGSRCSQRIPATDFWVFITNSRGSCWWFVKGICCCLLPFNLKDRV